MGGAAVVAAVAIPLVCAACRLVGGAALEAKFELDLKADQRRRMERIFFFLLLSCECCGTRWRRFTNDSTARPARHARARGIRGCVAAWL